MDEKMYQLLLDGQNKISTQLDNVREKLDEIGEKAIINQQDIEHIEKSFDLEKKDTKDRFKTVYTTFKWLAASVVLPITVSAVAFFSKWPGQ